MSIFPYQDPTFPKDPLTKGPDRTILDKMAYSLSVLSRMYKGMGKVGIQERFSKSLEEKAEMPTMSKCREMVVQLRVELPHQISDLEEMFGLKKKVNIGVKLVRGKKTNLKVSYLKQPFLMYFVSNDNCYFYRWLNCGVQ